MCKGRVCKGKTAVKGVCASLASCMNLHECRKSRCNALCPFPSPLPLTSCKKMFHSALILPQVTSPGPRVIIRCHGQEDNQDLSEFTLHIKKHSPRSRSWPESRITDVGSLKSWKRIMQLSLINHDERYQVSALKKKKNFTHHEAAAINKDDA